ESTATTDLARERARAPCAGRWVRYIVRERSREGAMSHGVHAVQHEVEHHIEHEEHGHGGRGKPVGESRSKQIALLISVMGLVLALAEMLGKRAQTEGISLNIKAPDTWNFSQAKPIRQPSLRPAAQALTAEAALSDETRKAALLKQADDWVKTVARYE